MLSAEKVPIIDGERASFQCYEQQVRLWMRMTKMEPSSRAAAWVLRMNWVARSVCRSTGGDQLYNTDGVTCVLEIPMPRIRYTR